jgi:hypothetical protein
MSEMDERVMMRVAQRLILAEHVIETRYEFHEQMTIDSKAMLLAAVLPVVDAAFDKLEGTGLETRPQG